jgi:23S rRNA pseudouridine2605 synthase
MNQTKDETVSGEGMPPAIRLQAYLASCGLGSRRACEALIVKGSVTVNGRAAELGMRVKEGEEVLLDGRKVSPQSRMRYILLNKPPGYISAMSDPEGRRLASDFLKDAGPERVYNVGRLDQWSCGLLLFTNDGELASRLGHPSGAVEKEYDILADAEIGEAFVREFQRGLSVDGIRYKAGSVRLTGPRTARVVLVEGKNREIRRVLAHFGLRPVRLARVRIGPLEMGSLGEGAWRELSAEEVASLRAASEHAHSENSESGPKSGLPDGLAAW